MTKTTLWPSHTGTITRMREGRGAKAAFVSFTLTMTKQDGSTFKRDAIAFGEVMDTVVALGVGARIYMRGPISRAQKTNASGQTYTVTSMTAMSVLHKPLDAENVDAADGAAASTDAPAMPALPEGASTATHQIYTRRDGTKAWRKRPARKSTPAVAEAMPAQEVVAATGLTGLDPSAITDDTAMGAALRRALMPA